MRPFLAQEDVWAKMFPGGVWEKMWPGRRPEASALPLIPPPPGAEGKPLWERPEGTELRRPSLPFSPRAPRPWMTGMSGNSPHKAGISWPIAAVIAGGAVLIAILGTRRA